MVSAEWALTAPIFILMVLACIAAVVHMNAASLTSNAAREVARSYAVGANETEAEEIAYEVAGKQAEVEITQDGRYVRATVTKPVVGALKFLKMDVSSTQVMLMEPGAR